MDFDARADKCPICHNWFRSDACPHSIEQAERRLQEDDLDNRIRRIVREELLALSVRNKDITWEGIIE